MSILSLYWRELLLLTVSVHLIHSLEETLPNGLENSPLSFTQGVVGEKTILACNMKAPTADDSPILVLFYKGDQRTPIFSVDSRDSSIYQASHWSDPSLAGRVSLEVQNGIQGLQLKHLRISDAGLYRCRVDFKASPTRNSRVHLQVIEPPRHILITSTWNGGKLVNNIIGPFPVGSEVTLACQVTGGSPKPQVSWWQEGSLLDNISELTSGDVTRNVLSLPKLTRADLLKMVTCQAVNSNLTAPLSTSVTIDLAFPPRLVRISSRNPRSAPESTVRGSRFITVIEGEPCPLQCKVIGSRPPPVITWKLDGRSINSEFETISSPSTTDEEATPIASSTLMLSATSADNRSIITCRAASPAILHESFQDSIHLNVLYKPQLTMKLGDGINLDNLEEGDDIEFSCRVNANPPVSEIQWTHNSVPLQHNESSGIFINNRNSTLILRKIPMKLSGYYSCASANSRGSSMSNIIEIKVKYAPRCSPAHRTSVGIGKAETSNISCTVDAHPPATTFRWAFNTSSELTDLPYKQQIHKNGSTSTIKYVTKNHSEYGMLLCWATNAVGVLKNPCQVQILPVDKPESVSGCRLNSNSSSPQSPVILNCEPGWDGGLNQRFTLEIRKASKIHARILMGLQHSNIPEFQIRNLHSSERYLLTVTAANQRGTSPPVTLEYTSPKNVIGEAFGNTSSQTLFETYMPIAILMLIALVVLTILGSTCAYFAKSHAAKKAKAFNEERNSNIYVDNTKDMRKQSLLSNKTDDDSIRSQKETLHSAKNYCIVNCKNENEYSHHFPNTNEDPETRALLKSSFGGSVGAESRSIEYPFTLRAASSLGRGIGVAPLAATDSLSGCSTLSTLSTTSRRTIRSSPSSLVGFPYDYSSNSGLTPMEYSCPRDSLLGSTPCFKPGYHHRKGFLKNPCECGVPSCSVPRESSV